MPAEKFKLDIDPELMAKKKELQADLLRIFITVFDNEAGAKVLEHLEQYSHKNFPNYDNANATYSKIGEQTLVAYIKSMLFLAKKGGE